MTPEEQWERECRRGRRWDSAYRWFVALRGLIVVAAVIAIECYREYLIWHR